jgi:hypothetical protein
MKTSKESHWRELWKTEDWLAVWVGFIIIILILSGLSLKMPSFRWTTGGEGGKDACGSGRCGEGCF